MIVQQVAPQQVVVATGGQQVTAGAQIRSQVLQHSPLPAQIVIAPAVQPPPQVVRTFLIFKGVIWSSIPEQKNH